MESATKKSIGGVISPGTARGVSRVIGWLMSTADGSLTCAQSVTMVRVMNFHVPALFILIRIASAHHDLGFAIARGDECVAML